jgi:hypothetical protein
MLVRRWWICHSSLTTSMEGDQSWSKRVPRSTCHNDKCMSYSSTHKSSLAVVLSRILQWWRLGVSSSVRLDGVGVKRRPLATLVAGNSRGFVFLDVLKFYVQI